MCVYLYCAHLLQADECERRDGLDEDHAMRLERCVSMCARYGARLLQCWCCVCGAVCVVDQSKVLQGEVQDGGVWADAMGGAMDR